MTEVLRTEEDGQRVADHCIQAVIEHGEAAVQPGVPKRETFKLVFADEHGTKWTAIVCPYGRPEAKGFRLTDGTYSAAFYLDGEQKTRLPLEPVLELLAEFQAGLRATFPSSRSAPSAKSLQSSNGQKKTK